MNLSSFRASLRNIGRNSFFRSVSVLVGGTACAQALIILSLPILTRLYTPEDFGILAVFTSLLGLISVVACLRLDIAIPIPKKDEEAANLLALALSSAFAIAAVVLAIVLVFPQKIVQLLNQDELQPYLALLPAGIALTGGYNAFQYWATRKKQFKRIAVTRAEQAIGSISIQLAFGLYNPTSLGLIVGQVIKSGAGLFGLLRQTIQEDWAITRHISFANMKCTFQKYSYFPRFSSAEALANSAAIQVPIIAIAAFSDDTITGMLALSMRVMQIPMSFIGSSIAQVYLSQAPEKLRSGELDKFSLQVLQDLIRVGVGPLVCIGILAPDIFSLVFGSTWDKAGELVRWMTPWFIFQFLSSPISMSLQVTDNQKTALGLQIYGFCIRTVPVWLSGFFYVQSISETYAVTGFIFYSTYLYVIVRVTQISAEETGKLAIRLLRTIITWGLPAMSFLLLKNLFYL